MKKVGSRELKNRLGKYLAHARKGETIVVTDRGEAVALLVPVKEIGEPEAKLEARLRHLAAAGHLRLPTRPFREVTAVRARGKPASRIIIEDLR